MNVISADQIDGLIDRKTLVGLMRDALIAHSRGECVTPMPMHLDVATYEGEVHVKSSYRQGGKYFVLKMAGTFPGNRKLGLSTGCGLMVLCSAQTGAPVVLIEDNGRLTDLRTAAMSAAVTRALGRSDEVLGILGTGIQARLQAQMHSAVLDLKRVVIWGRAPERVAECAYDIGELLPGVEVGTAATANDVAKEAKLIATCTASRAPLLMVSAVQAGSHIHCVGSDAPGKQELFPGLLKKAALLLADSRAQCEKLGELQHAPAEQDRVIEAGDFMVKPVPVEKDAITICDYTGLGVQDLYIAEHCYERTTRGDVLDLAN